MDKFIEEEMLLKSIRKSKDAYRRIKMNHTIRESSEVVKTKYKEPVERIQEVLHVLDQIEQAKKVLSSQVKEKSLEEKYKEYNTFKVLREELKAYEKTETIHEILRKIKAYMKDTEHFLDEVSKKRLILLLEGTSHENWGEFLVNKHEKIGLFINIVKEYAESAVKKSLEDKPEKIEDLLGEIEIFARTGLDKSHAESAIKELFSFTGSKITNSIGKRCYVFVKSVNSPIKKLKGFIEFTNRLLVSSTMQVISKLKIRKKIEDIVADAYKPIYKEAEEQFITGSINKKRLLDSDLYHLLKEMEGIEKLNEFIKKKQRKQKKLKEFYNHSKEKAKRAETKLEGMIFLLNSANLLNSKIAKKLPEKEMADEIVVEMRRKLNKAVDNPQKSNKIGEVLRYVEKAALKAKHYTIPIESRDYLIEEYKRSVREIAGKYGGIDSGSDSYLSETIEGFFNGPIRKLEKEENTYIPIEEKKSKKEVLL